MATLKTVLQACVAGKLKPQNSDGNYRSLLTGVNTTDTCTVTAAAVPGQAYWVWLKNLRGLGDSVIISAAVDCNHNITIPVQTLYSYTIYDSGGYSLDIHNKMSMTIRDTIIQASDTMVGVAYLRQ